MDNLNKSNQAEKKAKKEADLQINADTILTMNSADEILYNKSIIIKDGIIIDILDTQIADEKYIAQEKIKADDKIVMPGFINTHTHISMAYFKGLADDLPLDKWLQEYIWPAEAKCINPDFVYQSSLHGIAELIMHGITMFNDMYFIPQETVKACSDSGMRAILGDIVLDFPMGDFHKPEENLKKLYNHLESVKDNKLIDFSISPHSVYACSEESWKLAIETAKREKLLLHTHLSETKKEVDDCKLQKNGKTPVQYLYDLGAFETNFIFAHGVHLEKEDFKLIKNSNCSVAVNLHSNLKLASGIIPLKDYLDNNIIVSFGTDGVASNNTLNISNELSTVAKLFKTIYNDPSFLTAKELVKMATFNAAKALGKDKEIGSLETGKYADLICIDFQGFESQPVYDPFSYIIYSMNSEKISNVVINGKIVLKDKKLQTIDEDLLLENAKRNKQTIISRIQS